ncbi:PREDICTED: BTB/POZ and TAZ domain-containing protein 4 [Theobroma cacao]|uniref:BTB/POZ and TAZ domain-containing protein 4 n=1 Tax=Theobroma cacao TaxID=3641 RepID=A0AB32VJU3_THECC|nr:PREDICTED: BTB/POZ and TAZ domain-containing protein 4 [Theobroma cacao]
MGKMEMSAKQPPQDANNICPAPPPLPGPATNCGRKGLFMMNGSQIRGYSCVSTATRDLWDSLFDGGYRADIAIKTDYGGIVYAHSNILGMASPVLRGMLKQAKGFGKKRSITIHGVPQDAVRVFIRFLYSSCYEKEEMKEYVLQLLVLSHAYVVPQLKQICEQHLEHGLLTIENVIDVLQLALLCDAPRLSLISHRMILSNFKSVSATEGWKAMKKSHPALEKELLESVIDEENMRKNKIRKSNERKIYLQLYEAMEALVHICRDGCRTIGPHDKDFKEDQAPCNYAACKGLELLIRHFAGCKLRVPGGCVHCKRMWQLLELHSRLCADSSLCRVPLCRNFKEKIRKQSKKDEIKWKMLVKKILRTKRIGGAPFFVSLNSISS